MSTAAGFTESNWLLRQLRFTRYVSYAILPNIQLVLVT